MTRTSRKPEPNRRETILAATLELIAEGGVDSITHRRVANHAGIPLGSTTYYFESREHLIRAAFDLYLEEHRAIQEQIDIDPGKDRQSAVDFLVAFTAQEFAKGSLLMTEYEMTLFAAKDPVLAVTLNAWYDDMTNQIAAFLANLGARDAHELAHTILHLLRGHQLERLTRHTEDESKLRKRLNTLINAYTQEDQHA